MRLIVNEGDKYNKWTVIKEVEKIKTPNGSTNRRFYCICECGSSKIVRLMLLRSGISQSCGCHLEFDDLTGQVFNKWTVLEYIECSQEKHSSIYKCECECGTIKNVASMSLKNGKSKSCGCISKQKTIERMFKHGGKHEYLYVKYRSIKQRCYNKKYHQYEDYGGRGIKMCKGWFDSYASFRKYVQLLPNCPSKPNGLYTLDRIDNNGDYEPGNVKWSRRKSQTRNRRVTLHIKHKNETIPFAAFAELKNLAYKDAYSKYRDRAFKLA